MKKSRVLKIILLVSGLIAAGIGGTILVFPVHFYAMSDIEISGNVSLLNEIRAPAGALFTSGILIIFGVFFSELTFCSTIVSIVIYLSYGMSRFLSMAVDGMPSEGLVAAAVLEILVGLVCVVAFVKYRREK